MNDTTLAALFLFSALAAFYLVCGALADALGGRRGSWAYAVPALAVVMVAGGTGRFEVAMGTALSAAVASLGLVGGMTLLQVRANEAMPSDAGRWVLLIPGALVVLLVGLSGEIDLTSAVALVVVAGVTLPIIPADLVGGSGEGSPVPESQAKAALQRRSWGVWGAYLVLAAGIAGLGGWAAIEGTTLLARRHVQASAGLLAACILGPASVMPLLGLATSRVTTGPAYAALAPVVRNVIVSVLVLPVVAAGLYFGRGLLGLNEGLPLALPFPATLWRVECVLLLALSALLIPIATGRVAARRRDGAVLLGVYLLYLVLSALSGLRGG